MGLPPGPWSDQLISYRATLASPPHHADPGLRPRAQAPHRPARGLPPPGPAPRRARRRRGRRRRHPAGHRLRHRLGRAARAGPVHGDRGRLPHLRAQRKPRADRRPDRRVRRPGVRRGAASSATTGWSWPRSWPAGCSSPWGSRGSVPSSASSPTRSRWASPPESPSSSGWARWPTGRASPWRARPANFVERIGGLRRAPSARVNALGGRALCVATVLVVALWPRLRSRIPGPLVALLGDVRARGLLHLPVETIGSRFGAVPTGAARSRGSPTWTRRSSPGSSRPALSIALLAGIESLLSAVVADGMTGRRHRPNAELVAQGVANLVAPLFGGHPRHRAPSPAPPPTSRTAGARPSPGIVHASTLLLVLVVLGRWVALVPMATLAGILLVVAYNMSEWRLFLGLLRGPRSDVMVLLSTFALTVLVDLTVAIQVGVVLAALLFMRRMAEVSEVRVGHRPARPGRAPGLRGGEPGRGAARRARRSSRSRGRSSSARRNVQRGAGRRSSVSPAWSSCACGTCFAMDATGLQSPGGGAPPLRAPGDPPPPLRRARAADDGAGEVGRAGPPRRGQCPGVVPRGLGARVGGGTGRYESTEDPRVEAAVSSLSDFRACLRAVIPSDEGRVLHLRPEAQAVAPARGRSRRPSPRGRPGGRRYGPPA